MKPLDFFYSGIAESRIQGSVGHTRYKNSIRFASANLGYPPKGDKYGNIYIGIGKSRTIFSAHTDTAHQQHCKIVWQASDNYVYTDGKSALGADNASGVAVLMSLILNHVPGLYIFHDAEEKGGKGSLGFAHDNAKKLREYDRCIAFDRKGTSSIITDQYCGDTASYEFARSLSLEFRRLGMPQFRADDTGLFTDTANYAHIVPECTNCSVGYYNEHSFNECQDTVHLESMIEICPQINWENLITARIPDQLYKDKYSENSLKFT